MMDLPSLQERLKHYNQEHLLDQFDKLGENEKKTYALELSQMNFDELCSFFNKTMNIVNEDQDRKLDEQMEPIPASNLGAVTRSKLEKLVQYENSGLKEVSGGRVAVLLLAGGQGTRLGVGFPKGMYDVSLPSHKTLYQLQAERIIKLEQLAKSKYSDHGSIPWYIMTSEHTKEPTMAFFALHGYFGLQKDNLIVFEQGMLPCFGFDGKIILEAPGKIARAPDGNGGLYRALREKNILADMEQRNIQYVHVYCVDNILVKMADPIFIGYCMSKGADCGAKVVEKAFPTEAVGVVCRVGGIYQTVEYSEITLKTAQKRNDDGRLTFSAGNICNHFFTTSFLKQIVYGDFETEMLHHLAKKKVSYLSENGETIRPTKPNAIKLEKFVFDVFQFTSKFAVWEVIREDEFSPLKNSDGAEKDTPSTCRHSLFSLHHRYVLNAGGTLVDNEGEALPLIPSPAAANRDPMETEAEFNNNEDCQNELSWDECPMVVEISPLVSYAGEGLEELVSGKKFQCPLVLGENAKGNVSFVTKVVE